MPLFAVFLLLGLKAGQELELSELIGKLKSGDAEERRAAARSMSELPNLGPEAFQPLVAALDDSDEPLREAAAWALGRLTNSATPGGPFEKPPKPTKRGRFGYPYQLIEEQMKAKGTLIKYPIGTTVIDALVTSRGLVGEARVRTLQR